MQKHGNVARKATKKNLQRTFANVFSCVSTFARLRLDKGYFSKVLYGLQSVHEAVASCVQFCTIYNICGKMFHVVHSFLCVFFWFLLYSNFAIVWRNWRHAKHRTLLAVGGYVATSRQNPLQQQKTCIAQRNVHQVLLRMVVTAVRQAANRWSKS